MQLMNTGAGACRSLATWFASGLLLLAWLPQMVHGEENRPNVVWIMTEDNSVHYNGLYDPRGAEMPVMRALAEDGVIFDRAYSCAPVCSVARTTLITGCYAPRLSTQYHRRSAMITLPEGLQMFPAYLRDAGYFTTNNRKQDYNATGAKEAWDMSSGKASWRQRPAPEMPFFHVQTLTTTHESSLHFDQQRFENQPTEHDPASVEPHPYLPDSRLTRYTHSRYLDLHQRLDQQVGQLISQLKNDGVWENTIVFVFGDHGGVLPRSKGYAYDTGLHVPLVVRVPEKYRAAWSLTAGERDDRFVEFVDFGPTVLSIAGLATPEQMDGQAFLGPRAHGAEAFETALGYADRFDEKYDLVRSLHVGDYHYVRNFQPFYPDSLQNNYRYKMLAYADWRARHRQGQLSPVQAAFFESRPAEMLFDLRADPFEVTNLAGDPAHQEVLAEMRQQLEARLRELPDTSFIPEPYAIPEATGEPLRFAETHREEIGALLDTANLALSDPESVSEAWLTAARSDDAWQRYWAVTVAASWEQLPTLEMRRMVTALCEDSVPLVAARAAVAGAVHWLDDPRPVLLESLAKSDREFEALMILNDLVFVRDHLGGKYPVSVEDVRCRFGKGEVVRRLEYLGAGE